MAARCAAKPISTPGLSALRSATASDTGGRAGKTPAAIHVSPEALAGGPLAHVRDGDIIRLDADAGVLTTVSVPDLAARPAATRSQVHAEGAAWGYGRELFGAFRQMVGTAEAGASICFASPGTMNGHADATPDANPLDRMVDA